MDRIQRLAETREFGCGPFGLLNGQSDRALAIFSALFTVTALATGGAASPETPVAVFEAIQVDTAQAKVRGLLRIRNPGPDTLLLFPLAEAFPLGQIDVTLFRGDTNEVYRGWGAVRSRRFFQFTSSTSASTGSRSIVQNAFRSLL